MVRILVRYGEIALKSAPVRRRFEQALVRNIRGALHSSLQVPCRVSRGSGRILLDTPQEAVPILQRVFGIVSLSVAQECPADLAAMTALALALTKGWEGTFAVRTRRVGKHPFSSQQVNEHLGNSLRSPQLRVDLSHPQHTLHVEIRDRTAFLFTDVVQGQGGFPLGSQGKIVALIHDLEGVLAAWLFMRRGCAVVPFFPREPLGLEALEAWAFQKLPFRQGGSLAAAIQQERSLGLVVAHPGDIARYKQELGIPVYCPLLGMEEGDRVRMLKELGC
ncbi:MAG: hypothetical protein HY520_01050 [Candidatus Aenigmarchaeota archaeon]|nr:hypothetical protein [Candidatus Aenigmarchaeota archaeon]